MNERTVIFVHGYTSSPTRSKYRIIAEELDREGVAYAIPALPGGEHPHSREWLEIIHAEVSVSDAPVVLVGHSLGTRAVLLYLDQYEQAVDAVVLFSAFDTDIAENAQKAGGNFADFFEYPLDMEKVKILANEFVVVHSTDDTVIEYQQGKRLADELGAELITYEHMEHFSGEERAEENAAAFLKVVRGVVAE